MNIIDQIIIFFKLLINKNRNNKRAYTRIQVALIVINACIIVFYFLK